MARVLLVCLMAAAAVSSTVPDQSTAVPEASGATSAPASSAEDPPEGYYAFVESPNATPPRVRPPPYRQSGAECGERGEARPHASANNLCGDLNRGLIPRNPMGQSPQGEPYPFELIRNHTLKFLSRTLPVLRADDTLPRVAHLQGDGPGPASAHRQGRSSPEAEGAEAMPSSRLPLEHRGAPAPAGDTPRDSRKFCDGGGVFCMLYRAINGESGTSAGGVERREDPGVPHSPHPLQQPQPRYEGPPTPCPARVEYATPVFARNYQGVWRYVVQIPYEGYFTQTIEVTRCMQSRCHYLDGGCLSSPRWVSLLVAELHYPNVLLAPDGASASASPASPASPLDDFQDYQQFLQKRAGVSAGATTEASSTTGERAHCDGHDQLGCFQVRLYYDWFLVPGSCKCWRPDYFARYVRRKTTTGDL